MLSYKYTYTNFKKEPHPMYIISDPKEKHFLHQESNKSYSITTDRRQAYKWSTVSKANNVLTNLPRSLSFYVHSWKIIFDKQTPSPPKIQRAPSTNITNEVVLSIKEQLQEEINIVADQLSHYDKEKEDVLHYIEFNNLNACQGYKIYNLLHEIMKDRRAAKDKIEYLHNIMNNLDSAISPSEQSRTYKPRALPTLFTNGI